MPAHPPVPRLARLASNRARLLYFQACTRSQSADSWLETGDTHESGHAFRYKPDPSAPASAHRAAAG
jgi:hypothetical protein